MAALPDDFDHADDPSASFEPIPTRDEILTIVDSERRKTSAGDGEIYDFTIEIIEGPYRSRRVHKFFNIRNRNPQVQKIAYQQLRELRKAVGIATFTDTCELHNIPFIGKIVCKKDKKSGEYRNDISHFRRKDAAAVAAMNGNGQQGVPQPPSGGNDNPFKRPLSNR